MKLQHSTASCKVNFNAGDHMQNTPLTPKKAVKLTAKPELSDTCRICKLYLKLQSVIAGRKTSTVPLKFFLKEHAQPVCFAGDCCCFHPGVRKICRHLTAP